ncbi:MAG TPA: hypothetical protein VEI73_01850 [Candidatus Acidoferrum sp.]|nr:hypothetical protein [Candidatus Acidoferrum sp.]
MPVQFLTDLPLTFDYDPDTGLLSVLVQAGIQRLGVQATVNVELLLTPKASQSLLSDLPKLETLLRRASEGPTKPRSVQ